MQNKEDLIFSYLINTKFYDNLRNRLSGTLSAQELRQLINGLQSIVRYKCENIICEFDQPVIVIIVYGEVEAQLKANVEINGVQAAMGKFTRRLYGKGQYFRVEKDVKDIPLNFIKATTLMLLNSQVLDHRIENIIAIRQKIKLVQKCLPVKQLKLTLSQIRKIAKLMQLNQIKGKYERLYKKAGVYLFYEGIFQICNNNTAQPSNLHTLLCNAQHNQANPQINNQNNINNANINSEMHPTLLSSVNSNTNYSCPFIQMQNNFIEVTEQLQFGIRLKTVAGKYGYIGRTQFYSLLEPEAISQMQKCWKNKIDLRDYYNSKKQYIQQSQILRQKIKSKIRKARKIKLEQRSKYQTNFRQNLQTSRKIMLQKCSTYTSRQYSAKSPHKTTYTLNKTASATATNWTTYREKQKQKQRDSKTPTKSIKRKNEQIVSQRLGKMRIHSQSKSSRKFQKQWYYLDEAKMNQSINMSYYKIKKQETRAQNVREMCNYKRVHRIYSDPCFKKQLSYRNCWFY